MKGEAAKVGRSRQTAHPESSPPRPGVRALNALIEEEWEWAMQESPTWATVVGDDRYDDRWPDMSPEAHQRRDEHARQLLRRIEVIDRDNLPDDGRLNYDLFLREAKLDVEGLEFPARYMPLNQMNGVHQDVADILQIAPRRTERDLDNIIARLHGVRAMVEQNIALMRRGLELNVTPPRVILEKVPEGIRNQIVDDPASSPVARLLLADLPSGLSKAARQRFRAAIQDTLRDEVIPAYRDLARFIDDEYLPRARTDIGLKVLPDGEAWYAHQIRVMTTSDMCAAAIHELGLAEVRRIRGEMDAIMRECEFDGTLPEFFRFLRSDTRFFFTDKMTLLMTYRDIAKRIDPQLPRLFKTLPRLPYGVVPVPAYSEKFQTTAYYHPGSFEAGRPGYFYANTYNLKARPKWEMEALTAHEAVPGHHLQISLAQEMTGLPKFRRFGGNTAYIEGWGLYSESLGKELGLYEDPYSRFGQLTYEMWRAIRLVVDTGLHALDWSREQAVVFFEENAGKAGHDIEVEVDRYIAWPAQALAYKIGELKFKALRADASRTLGERFDIREFHDVVLGAGPLPLSILEDRVKSWAATK